MAANQNIARLGIVLGLETGEYTRQVNEIIQANKNMKTEVNASVRAISREIEDLTYATENYGKVLTKTEQVEQNIKRLRYTEANVGKDLIKTLRDQAAAYDAKAAAAKKAMEAEKGGAGGKLSAYQLQALSYQTTDIVTSLAGGQNPMLVLLQQGGQLKDQFGGVTNVFKAFAEVLTPTRVLIGGVAASLGTLAYQAYQGYQEFKRFRDDLILTNNYAGISIDTFDQLSSTISKKVNGSLTDSKTIFSALVASGKFTNQSIASVGEAIARVTKLSGESADSVAKELMPAFNGTASAVGALNDKYHFLTIEQYKNLEVLEKQGKYQKLAKDASDALIESLKKHEENLGSIEQMWKNIKDFINEAAEGAKKIGRKETAGDEVAELQAKLRYAESINLKGINQARVDSLTKELDAATAKAAKEKKDLEEASAKTAANDEKLRKYREAGGADAERALRLENEKILSDAIFQDKVDKADKFVRLQLESEKRIRDYNNQQDEKNYQQKGVFAQRIEKLKADFAIAEEKRVKQQINEINRQQFKQYNDALIAEKAGVDLEREKLELYKQNILLSDTDYQIAVARKEAEKDIARYKANKELTEEGRQKLIDQKKAIVDSREEVIRLGESLKVLKDINQAVFKNMTDAITNFILTGKLNFKNFAATVIAEILRIQAAALAAQATRGIFGLFGGSSAVSLGSMALGANPSAGVGFGLTGASAGTGGASGLKFASGGQPPVGMASLVGENGPELFIPRTAGTIVPNSQMNQALGGTTNVTNNYINAIDTKSFEDRIYGSANAVWAANQYANNKTIATSRSRT